MGGPPPGFSRFPFTRLPQKSMLVTYLTSGHWACALLGRGSSTWKGGGGDGIIFEEGRFHHGGKLWNGRGSCVGFCRGGCDGVRHCAAGWGARRGPQSIPQDSMDEARRARRQRLPPRD